MVDIHPDESEFLHAFDLWDTQEEDTRDSHDMWESIMKVAEQEDEAALKGLPKQWRLRYLSQAIIDGGLQHAIRNNHTACVRLLLDYGAKLDEDTVSLAAEGPASIEVWQEFLDHGWDINSFDSMGRPMLTNFLSISPILSWFCADDPSLQVHPLVNWFLFHGASITARCSRNQSVLSFAAGYRPMLILRTLLEYDNGVSKDALDRSNALHEAAGSKRSDRTEAIMLLVDEFGADVNAISIDGERHGPGAMIPEAKPLHWAISSGRREYVWALLERGASVTGRDGEGYDVRRHAERWGWDNGWRAVEEWYAEKGMRVPGDE